MSRSSGPVPEGRSRELDRLIAAACEQFKGAWCNGNRPAIGPFLDGLGQDERTAVLHELIALELELRSAQGDRPTIGEYLERFPDDAPAVTTVFASSQGPGPACDELLPTTLAGDPLLATISMADRVAGEGCGRGESQEPQPRRLGRYEVVRVLGRGGFGIVYLARDNDLDRDVAIKVPTFLTLAIPRRLESLLEEARLAAGLRHPAIVGVYDVGRDDQGMPFVVLEYVEGTTLADLLRQRRIEPARLAALVATVADAVHHAHKAGLVHRDLKPSNIMIDAQGAVRVADFGLAVTEALQVEKVGEIAGTPTHMAPEQVRGETHRLDGRTDVWALGVILYQGLTGRLPFLMRKHTALFDEILNRDPKPPRQIDDAIPRELERICLKCLSKRMTERYSSSMDLAGDLREWLAETGSAAGDSRQHGSGRRLGDSAAPGAHVVPKGLRAFDKQDADTFRDLLPGPRGRDGVPESVRFWKARIEDLDGDSSFSVGLLFGPSGCGKSSLIKAGLLPLLADRVVPVFVECTPAETESRLAAALAGKCHGLAPGSSCSGILAAIRQGEGLGSGRKLLVVLDQLEQWLHSNEISLNAELVRALRQCDGVRAQALLIVRDDFWVSVTRYFRMIDVRLSEEANCAAVEPFDVHHAETVLAAFGRAFGALPPGPDGLTRDHKAFVAQSVGELAQRGQVSPVHLSVFAEMVKGQEWTPGTLESVGGARGLGVAFLEKAFGDGAPPYRRVHQRAAREVLDRLLPASGVDIKGHMRSRTELVQASGYIDRPDDFAELTQILDSELKLVTPTDRNAAGGGEPHYQLTHDFLVPALREWLVAKQRETRRGRAELRLAERAALWGDRREPRQLPSIAEWLTIALLTSRRGWSRPEADVMKAASRRHLFHAACGLVLAVVTASAVALAYAYEHAHTLVERLLVTETGRVPGMVESLGPYKRWVHGPLLAAADDPSRSSRERLHARLALLPSGAVKPESLVESLLTAGPEELDAIVAMLSPYRRQLAGRLWPVVESAALDRERRLRAACVLASFDPEASAWRRNAPAVAGLLFGENPLLVNHRVNCLRPVRRSLIGPLADAADGLNDPGTRRLATSIVIDYSRDDPERLVDLLVNADSDRFAALLAAVSAHRGAAIPLLQERARGGAPPSPTRRGLDATEKDADIRARHRATAAAALLRLGEPDAVWPLLAAGPDPRVQAETVWAIAQLGQASDLLAERLRLETDVSVRMALLLALADGAQKAPGAAWIERAVPFVLDAYRNDPDPGVHGAARLLLDRAGRSKDVRQFDAGPDAKVVRPGRGWFVDGGHTMVVIDPIGRDPALSGGRSIDRVFALSSTETTLGQFIQFRPRHPYLVKLGSEPEMPVGVVTWYDAAAYCSWLDEQEHVPLEERCYPPPDQITEGMSMPKDYLRRTGHRLPTFAEWEYAARALTRTRRHFGDRDGLLGEYAWFQGNSGGLLHPVGGLKPNGFGLFDVYGSMLEWCQDWIVVARNGASRDVEDLTPVTGNSERVIRSGAFNYVTLTRLTSDYFGPISPVTQWDTIGFRIARTIRPAH